MDAILIFAAVLCAWLLTRGHSSAQSQGSTVASYGRDGLDNVSEGIAQYEGFYLPGSLAARTMNPGNIGTFGGNVASYPDVGDGWDALKAWISSHTASNPDWDFYDMMRYYLTGSTTGKAGPGQNPDAYAEYIADYLGVSPTDTVASVIGG